MKLFLLSIILLTSLQVEANWFKDLFSSKKEVQQEVITPKKVIEVEPFKVVRVEKFINHGPKELKRNQQAIEKIREHAYGQCFEKEFLASKLIQTNGKTNAEVLKSLREAQVIISLEMYRSFKNTVGYTYPNVDNLWLNKKFHDYYGPCDAGSNIFHELGHKIGYGHDFKPSYSRQFSVPYTINKVMGICCTDNVIK